MTGGVGRIGVAAIVLLASLRMAAAQQTLDDFEDVSGWTAIASDGAQVELARDTGHTGMGMRLDFDLGAGGYVIARKAFSIMLPSNYAFRFYLRGDAPANNFEFKLVDRTGDNVWWRKQRAFTFPPEWREVIVKQPHLTFAWGPSGGKPLRHVGYVEIAISAGSGGKGSVWIDELRFEQREPLPRVEEPPKVTASTAVPDHPPEAVLQQTPQATWRSGTLGPNQWLLLDFSRRREFGGLVIDWGTDDYATQYHVQISDDGETWTSLYSSTRGNGGRDYIYMPDTESRYVRLDLEQSSRGQGYEIRSVAVQPLAFSATLNQFFEAMARDAPPGTYPKYFSGRQTYWTVVGVAGDERQALLNEEGMIEVGKTAFSIEPFVYAEGQLLSWNGVHTTQTLEDDYLPMPAVTWRNDHLTLKVSTFAAGRPGRSTLYATYRVENTSDHHQDVSLFLAIRPFQVLPPWQSLNLLGGVTPIRDVELNGPTVSVNRDTPIVLLTAPDHFGAAAFDAGPITSFLATDRVPPETQVSDAFGYASAALQYRMMLDPGAAQEVYVAVPFQQPTTTALPASGEDAATQVRNRFDETKREWQASLDHVEVQLPPAAAKLGQTLKSTLAYILINRDGPALRPGARTYARSWIRDGAMTSAALLEMGYTQEVRDFIRWYAGYQLADGKVPCCVDRRGADRVSEYDSNGEFLFTIAEYYRYTHDVGLVHEQWPAIVRAVEYLTALRQQRLTDAFKDGDKQLYYGLLPESISHEGYSSRPVHSYWDDFWALRDIKDAASMAMVVGDEPHATSFGALRDAFRTDLYASITRTMTHHKIDYIPGSVELGDFDPTSTSIALTLGGERAYLPEPALTRTFDAYWAVFDAREHEADGNDAYTPYELRNVGALIHLGQRDRALALLDTIMADQRPSAWNQWPEVLWHDAAAPRFIGDMPHTWVGSSFIHSVRSMLAYEREGDHALVIAAGLPASWISGAGMSIKRLPTYYGVLNYTLRSEAAGTMHATLSGDINLPPGNLVLQPPLPQPLKAVSVNGKPVQTFDAKAATITEFPADVVLEY